MDYARSDVTAGGGDVPATAKILIAGGLGVGKPTLIGRLLESADREPSETFLPAN